MVRLALVLALLGARGFAQSGSPTVPHLVNYQGLLVGANGTNLPDGNYVLAFNIYSNATAGIAPLWGPQIFDGQNAAGHGAVASLVGGRFNVILGPADIQGNDIASALVGTNLFLSITVGGTTNIVPLQQILSAPFALRAANSDTLGGVGGWEVVFGQPITSAANAYISGNKIQAGSITAAQLAPASVGASQIAPSSIVGTNLAVPLQFQASSPYWLIQATNFGGPAIGGFSLSSHGVVGQGVYNGVYGISTVPGGVGVRGEGQGVGMGVFAEGNPGLTANGPPSGYAAVFNGNVQVNGTVFKSASTFRIDHPLDPANKYLSHSIVESPDMKNIYDGIAILDETGRAKVSLPDWFEAVNQDYRYQLTAVGAPAPNLHVAQEIAGRQFIIGGGTKGLKVSWQVTGIRRDAWANAHRIVVEQEKPASEKGLYLAPEELGQPKEKGVFWKLGQGAGTVAR
jgi:hypothetical protein